MRFTKEQVSLIEHRSLIMLKALRVIFEPGNVWGFYREAPDSGSKITSFDYIS